MERTITIDADVLDRMLARIRHRVEELDGELSNIPAGAPRRKTRQSAYDQAHGDYLALVKARTDADVMPNILKRVSAVAAKGAFLSPALISDLRAAIDSTE